MLHYQVFQGIVQAPRQVASQTQTPDIAKGSLLAAQLLQKGVVQEFHA